MNFLGHARNQDTGTNYTTISILWLQEKKNPGLLINSDVDFNGEQL